MMFFRSVYGDRCNIARSFCEQSYLLWDEEFDTFRDDVWTKDVNVGNDSLVRDSYALASNVWVEDSELVIRSDRYENGTIQGYRYTSGAVTSNGKKSFGGDGKKVRVCVCAMLPGGGTGIWPAHWLMPDANVCWPHGGEIDIMEMVNSDGTCHGTYHWSDKCAVDHDQGGSTNMPKDWNSTYHEFAVEYDGTSYVSFVLDGNVYKTVKASSGATMYTHPYYVLLNTAIGGPWPAPPTPETIFPTYHRIDYVRVSGVNESLLGV
ncbi:glycoside hydrolase family 16 protein [bacterium]|nr:glycoside hydrolase family 16 protein [bacterium]